MISAVEDIMTDDGMFTFILQLWHSWKAVGNVPMSLSKEDDKESSSNRAAEREIKQEQYISQMHRRKENMLCKIR